RRLPAGAPGPPAPPPAHTAPLHGALPIYGASDIGAEAVIGPDTTLRDTEVGAGAEVVRSHALLAVIGEGATVGPFSYLRAGTDLDRKSTRLNSSHVKISYAAFCWKTNTGT